MRLFNKINLMTTSSLASAANARVLVPTAAERRRGRFMRSEDGHGGAAADAGGGSGAEGSAADGGGGDQGGGSGADSTAGAEGGADQAAADAAAGGKSETILGGAAADGGADGAGDKSGEGEAGKEGEAEGKGDKDGKTVEVLGAPEKYDLKLPEAVAATGMTFDQEAFDAVEPILRDLNLSNDAAGALIGAYAEKVLPLLEKRAGDRMDAGSADMRRGWEADARADPDIGGAKFDETKALARQTFTRFGVKSDGPFLKLLEESGLGSHPDMLRFVANVGRLTGEARVDTSGGGQQATRLADRVYGKPTPRE